METIKDSEDCIFVNAGEYCFVEPFSKITKVKTIGLGTCLGLVTYSKSKCVGSLTHVISTFNTYQLIFNIINFYSLYNIKTSEIYFKIFVSKHFDENLLVELALIIEKTCPSENIEVCKLENDLNLLFDFAILKPYNFIVNANLNYPKDIIIGNPGSDYKEIKNK